ncbi:GTPase [Halostreptopolyspora alba]|uniref:G domain-containing protein n=1 Tax=Halostreptopolyspora alba TaxID=2487137 RepID=A0A3N0EHQ2_9ACTN|nr:hypothetical protein EFW17_00215 [Nocardiopsaceae bacterium YIM 96095]
MTTQRHSPGADDDPGANSATDPPGEPESSIPTGGRPDPGATDETVEAAARPGPDSTEWGGYVIPPVRRTGPDYAPGPSGDDAHGDQLPAWVTGGHGAHDAGWATPAGDAPPSHLGEGTDLGSYPALRRAVDALSGLAAESGDLPSAAAEAGDRADPRGGTEESAPSGSSPGGSSEHESGEGGGTTGATSRGGKHARRSRVVRMSRSASEERAGDGQDDSPVEDQDDPENLAGWVGSLVGAVDSEDGTPGPAAIAGRRSGSSAAQSGTGTDTGASGDTGDPAGEGEREPSSWSEPERSAEDDAETETSADIDTNADTNADTDTDTAPATSEPAAVEDTTEWGSLGDDPDDYVPSAAEPWEPMPAVTREELIERLDNLALLIEIGRDDFDAELIARARGLLTHAGARLRLSGDHTIVALAGGTGSGKSSLFNALCGLEFSRVGVTRPTTSSVHACVWGNDGADGILDWLGVPQRARHSRTSVLDKSTSELHGLILLDLPDHDSVRAVHTEQSDRLISSADLLIWVLDPQKYADAAVHHRYLAEMAGHGAVTVAVLNKVDRVDPDELEEVLTDLRRLLETESGAQPRVLTTSTLLGEGLGELRELLAGTVSERRALVDRLVADLDPVVGGFERYRGTEEPPARVPEEVRQKLAGELVDAGGAPAVADATGTTYERRGHRSVGWPVGRWVRALRRDPLRSVQLDFVREGSEEGLSESVRAQLPEVETAAAEAADHVGGSLPSPWPRRLRAAARTNVADLPRELGSAVAATVPSDDTPSWWRTVRALQYLLVGAAGIGLTWFGVALVSWLGGGLTGMSPLDHPINIGYAAAVAVAALVVGKLIDIGCRNLVEVASTQQRDEVARRSSERVRSISDEWIVAPLEEELQRYRAYTQALDAASARPTE